MILNYIQFKKINRIPSWLKYLADMNLLSKKTNPVTLIAVVIMAISISIFDFDNLSWNNNSKSYIGLLLFLVFIAFRYRINKIKN